MYLKKIFGLAALALSLLPAAYGSPFLIGISRGSNLTTKPSKIYSLDPLTGKAVFDTTVKGFFTANAGLFFAQGNLYASDLNTGKYAALQFGIINPKTGVFQSAGNEDRTTFYTFNSITGKFTQLQINSNWQGIAAGKSNTFYTIAYRPSAGKGPFFRCTSPGKNCVAAPDLNSPSSTLEKITLTNGVISSITVVKSLGTGNYVDVTSYKGSLYAILYSPTGDSLVNLDQAGNVLSTTKLSYTYFTVGYKGVLIKHVVTEADQLLGFSIYNNGFYLSDGTNFGPEANKLFTINPINGSLTLIGTEGDGSFFIDGLADSVPEPGTLMLLGSGLLGVAASLRRRKRVL